MNTKQVREAISEITNTLSSRGGVFTAKKSYYWGLSNDGSALADKIKSRIPGADIVDYGNHFHDFVGGAKPGSPQDSYYWVKFKA